MIQKTTPFKPSGTFKKGLQCVFINNEVCTPQMTTTGMKLLPLYKEKGIAWTTEDCPQVVKRLIAKGETIESLEKKTGYKQNYIKALYTNSIALSIKALIKFDEVEKQLKDGE